MCRGLRAHAPTASWSRALSSSSSGGALAAAFSSPLTTRLVAGGGPAVEQDGADLHGLAAAWAGDPILLEREALGKLLSEVRLSPGGVTIRYGLGGYQGHDPYGPL